MAGERFEIELPSSELQCAAATVPAIYVDVICDIQWPGREEVQLAPAVSGMAILDIIH